MSSNTASADTPTHPTLICPSNFQITVKLQREKVLDTTTTVPVPATSSGFLVP
ncbi:hypothetical protein PAXRUDRAFT_13095 [Paxillus rubicundulus Ve08.2h10]|uniref:Uncharacterized protein n=1 Tax=Paxillus rubicundulus Ve08.2h10 TaxID=930991 RepID=A0A0D0DZQ3_9AGAM|nr:hypothetical protein PAXRUDRAFT_13095 [Paxillus rubicundulus Ve08.2h10]